MRVDELPVDGVPLAVDDAVHHLGTVRTSRHPHGCPQFPRLGWGKTRGTPLIYAKGWGRWAASSPAVGWFVHRQRHVFHRKQRLVHRPSTVFHRFVPRCGKPHACNYTQAVDKSGDNVVGCRPQGDARTVSLAARRPVTSWGHDAANPSEQTQTNARSHEGTGVRFGGASAADRRWRHFQRVNMTKPTMMAAKPMTMLPASKPGIG